MYSLIDLLFGRLFYTQAERNIVIHCHIPEQRIALEYHSYPALASRYLVHHLVVDQDLYGIRLLQPGNHPQRGGLPTAGGTQQRDKSAVLNLQIHMVHSQASLAKFLCNIIQSDRRHINCSLLRPFQWKRPSISQ